MAVKCLKEGWNYPERPVLDLDVTHVRVKPLYRPTAPKRERRAAFWITRWLLSRWHYLHQAPGSKLPQVTASWVLELDGVISGVAVVNPPPAGVVTQMYGTGRNRHVWGRRLYCLTRTCLGPGRPQHATGVMVARSLEQVPAILDDRCAMMATFANTCVRDPDGQPHSGVIYQATNWAWAGHTESKPGFRNKKTGAIISRKSGPRNLTLAELGPDWEEAPPQRLSRFLVPVGRDGRQAMAAMEDSVQVAIRVDGYSPVWIHPKDLRPEMPRAYSQDDRAARMAARSLIVGAA